ncbi:hypothetical protein EDC05_005545 [Coemansia umbellata]|nr:hypothetical protein EDC05_005545 [Coemansia umbellata]
MFLNMPSFLRRPRAIVRFLRWYWAVLLFVGEIGLYYWHINSCNWPTSPTADSTHVAIIADPQIVDHYSYGQTGLLLRLVEFYTDIYMRKSYRLLQDIQQPSVIINLGDLMDGGREWADDDWLPEYQRYRSIFTARYPMRVYEMAGNHDIGIGNTVVQGALERFHKTVGPTNQVIELGGHQIVLLDTLTLESDSPEVSSASNKLVEWLAKQNDEHKPRLLFTHVPMWRPNNTLCGPLRQSLPWLRNRRGYQFRDQLFQNTTTYLLERIKPLAVFSGDDHDTCIVEHQVPGTTDKATEYTIGAFGWASGVPIASYALLTLYPEGFMIQNCFLPYQLGIYKTYVLSFVLSFVLLAHACSYRRYQGLKAWRGCDRWLSVGGLWRHWLISRYKKPEDGSIGGPEEEGEGEGAIRLTLLPIFQGNNSAETVAAVHNNGYRRQKLWRLLSGLFPSVVWAIRDIALVATPFYISFILFFYI